MGKDYLQRNPFRDVWIRVQRDLNPRPAAPQAVILSMLNYEPSFLK